MTDQNDKWRDWLIMRDARYGDESAQTIAALKRLEKRVEVNTNITLMIFAMLSGKEGEDAEAFAKKWQGIVEQQ